jgi:hypothetical protein
MGALLELEAVKFGLNTISHARDQFGALNAIALATMDLLP